MHTIVRAAGIGVAVLLLTLGVALGYAERQNRATVRRAAAGDHARHALLGIAFVTTEAFGRALGLTAIATGVVNVAAFFVFMPFALPLSGILFVWLGVALFRAPVS